MTIAALVALVILVGLGNWQMRRLAWKETLIAQVNARVELPPAPLAEVLGYGMSDDITYTPAIVSGVFDHAREIHLFGQNLDGFAGYFIYTPLMRDGDPTVIVNRGFVPVPLKDPAARPEGQVEGHVTLTGLVRAPRTGNAFQPQNDADRNEWFTANLDEMASHLGEVHVVPVFVDAGAASNPGRWPQGGQTRISFRNNHLGYALTWYGLAVTLLGVYIAVHIGAGRMGFNRRKA